jgi:hypothetical protein
MIVDHRPRELLNRHIRVSPGTAFANCSQEADMADQNTPNEASRKHKAEGERWSPESENATGTERSGYHQTEETASGITNRPIDEEIANQESLPRRGESQPGAHAGHGERGSSTEDR